MVKYNYKSGILTVHVFSCKRRIDPVCGRILALMDNREYTSGLVLVNFCLQSEWGDYYSFILKGEHEALRIHAIGVIIEDDARVDMVEWRAGLLRPLGIDTRIFRTVSEMQPWAESKLPEQVFGWIPGVG